VQGRRYPLVVEVHGGRRTRTTHSSGARIRLMRSSGARATSCSSPIRAALRTGRGFKQERQDFATEIWRLSGVNTAQKTAPMNPDVGQLRRYMTMWGCP